MTKVSCTTSRTKNISSGDKNSLSKCTRDGGKVVKRRKRRKSRNKFKLFHSSNLVERSSSVGTSDDHTDSSPSPRPSSPSAGGSLQDHVTTPTLPPPDRILDDHVMMPTMSRDVDLVALDCEMVSVRGGKSSLAQCSIVSYDGETLYHTHVRPSQPITDYRTRWSGVLPRHMKNALPHDAAVAKIRQILAGKILIGHDLTHDFSVIGITPPRHRTRDTAHFIPLRSLAGLSLRQNPSLKNLSLKLLGRRIQNGFHNSLEDARAALDLYRKHETLWEKYLVERNWDRTVWLQDQYWPNDIN